MTYTSTDSQREKSEYRVTLESTYFYEVVVEAESEKKARKKALKAIEAGDGVETNSTAYKVSEVVLS